MLRMASESSIPTSMYEEEVKSINNLEVGNHKPEARPGLFGGLYGNI